jgi:hypothetical protein
MIPPIVAWRVLDVFRDIQILNQVSRKPFSQYRAAQPQFD